MDSSKYVGEQSVNVTSSINYTTNSSVYINFNMTSVSGFVISAYVKTDLKNIN